MARTRWTGTQALPRKAAAAARFISADGRHVVASERIGNDSQWEKYRWTVEERASGRRVGEIRSHLSIAPFYVRDTLIIFPTTPYARREIGAQPSKLRAFDLQSGEETWSVELRETEYRGAPPP